MRKASTILGYVKFGFSLNKDKGFIGVKTVKNGVIWGGG